MPELTSPIFYYYRLNYLNKIDFPGDNMLAKRIDINVRICAADHVLTGKVVFVILIL